MICNDLHVDLRKLFAAPGYLYMAEVRNATGFDATRSADAMALGMYQSRGRELWGFEMKVSRADWKKELEQPAKAESWMRYCDRWALVISDLSFVHAGELPVSWGMYAPVKGKLKCVVPAPVLSPEPLSRVALTALVYAATQADAATVRRQIDDAVEVAVNNRRDVNEYKAQELDKLKAVVSQFQTSSGLYLPHGRPEDLKALGEAVRLVLGGGGALKDRMETLDYAVSAIENMIPAMKTQRDALRSLMEGRLNETRQEAGVGER